MSWWNGLIGRNPESPAQVAFPVDVELIARSLGARVYLHDLDTRDGIIRCWTYVSDGLLAHRQKEIIFTLRCQSGQAPHAYPKDPLDLFRWIHQAAQSGELVDVGGFTQFGSRGFFGRHLVYIQPQPLRGVALPGDAVAAILVTDDEVLAVQEFGITRVMSRLGFATRYYPCPPWSDPSRRGLSFARTRTESILARLAPIHAPGVSVLRCEQRIEIRVAWPLPGRLATHLAELALGTPIALLTRLDSTANGCLVWKPGQTGPEAIAPPDSDGSRLCGCFVLLVGEQSKNEMRVTEDGYGLLLTTSSWTAIRDALLRRQEADVRLEDSMHLSVEWLQVSDRSVSVDEPNGRVGPS